MFLDKEYHINRIMETMEEKNLDVFESYFIYSNFLCENYGRNDKKLVEVAFIPLLLRSLASDKAIGLVKKFGKDAISDGIEDIKQKSFEWISDKLGMSGNILKSLKEKISDLDESDLPKLFSDKKFLTDFIFGNVLDYGTEKLSSLKTGEDGFIMGVFRDFLVDAKNDDAMAEKMKSVLYNYVEGKVGSTMNNIKDKIFGS